MTRTFNISRKELKNKDLKSAKRTTDGSKPEVRDVKRIALVLKTLK